MNKKQIQRFFINQKGTNHADKIDYDSWLSNFRLNHDYKADYEKCRKIIKKQGFFKSNKKNKDDCVNKIKICKALLSKDKSKWNIDGIHDDVNNRANIKFFLYPFKTI